MSATQLPDDLSQWPRDPYALLGVKAGVSTRELRKAYSQLIRRFKPEQHPEHFRRIRDAYETIERELKFNQAYAPPTAEPAPADDGVFGQRTEDAGGDAVRVNPWYPPLSESIENEIDEAWAQAVSGETQAAYRQLQDLYYRHGNKADLAARLYWLLAVQPELDAQRVACDWLAQGLCDQKLQGPCRELYRRELDRNPAEAVSERYSSLLRQAVDAKTLADFVQWRWLAAGRLQNADVIGNDVDQLGAKMRSEDEDAWVRLLLLAVDQLAWLHGQPAQAVLKSCLKEIEEAAHVHARLGDAMIRLDVVLDISANLGKLRDERIVSADLATLLPKLWTQPLGRIRPELLAWLERLRHDPQRWLRDFDFLHRRAPTLLAQVGRSVDLLLDCLPSPYADGRRPDVLAGLVLDFLEASPWRDYSDIRPRLLDFCLNQFIAPETVLHFLEQVPKYVNSGLTQWLQEDWPLRYVCLGHRMFWASA